MPEDTKKDKKRKHSLLKLVQHLLKVQLVPEVEEAQEFQRLLLNQKEEKFLRQESPVHQILKLGLTQLHQERSRNQMKMMFLEA